MSIINVLNTNKEYILNSIKNGVSTVKLGKEFNCNPGYIHMFCSQNNVYPNNKRKNYGEIKNRAKQIIDMYNSGMSAYKIGKELGFAKCSILRLLKDNNIDTTRDRKLDPSKDLLKNQADDVIKMYQNNMSQNQIAKELGYSNSQVCILLNKYNIKARPINIYNYDESYFKNIDTPEKSYFLGLFYADGCNMNDIISISLQERDLYILEECKRQIKYSGDLHYVKKRTINSQPQYKLSISRTELSSDLTKLGAMKNKTFKIRFPYFIDKELWSSFLAGYTMGDGSINKKYYNVASNIDFINDIKNIFPVTGNIYSLKESKSKKNVGKYGCSLFVCKIKDRVELYKWLYSVPCSFFQYDRKYQKAMEFIKQYG